jgi:hypothetical protein
MSNLGVVQFLQNRGYVKYLLCLSDCNRKRNVLTDFGKKRSSTKFYETRSTENRYFPCGQRDKLADRLEEAFPSQLF